MASSITEVRLTSRVTHEHIASVKLSSGVVETVATVIQNLRSGHVYYTYKPGTLAGRVYVHACPRCGSRDYITTHPDSTTTNNLLHLPKF